MLAARRLLCVVKMHTLPELLHRHSMPCVEVESKGSACLLFRAAFMLGSLAAPGSCLKSCNRWGVGRWLVCLGAGAGRDSGRRARLPFRVAWFL